jgi:hypothetical protein
MPNTFYSYGPLDDTQDIITTPQFTPVAVMQQFAQTSEFDNVRREIAEADAAMKKQRTHYYGKSGTYYDVQIGTCWYPPHDTKVYTPFSVLTGLISKGDPGYVRHNDSLRILKRLIKSPDFGTITQIAYSLLTGQGAMREFTTYLLDKRQFLTVAAAMNDTYVHLAAKALHSQLTPEELNMTAHELHSTLMMKANKAEYTAAKAETLEQTTARLEVISSIEVQLETWKELEETLPSALEFAELQLKELSAVTEDPKVINPDMWDIIEATVKCAAEIRDTTDMLLNSKPATLETSNDLIMSLPITFGNVNGAVHTLIRFAEACSTRDWAMKYNPYDNSQFVWENYHMFFIMAELLKINEFLNKEGFYPALPVNPRLPRIPHDDVVEFGIYLVLYDRLADSKRESDLISAFSSKYAVSPKQIARLRILVENKLNIPKVSGPLVIVNKLRGQPYDWTIFSAGREGISF